MEAVSVLERMRADLDRALKKPSSQRRWAMVIDIRRCVGCHACTVSCKAENKTPPGVDYRFVKDVEDGEYPEPIHLFMPGLCMQCDNPKCVSACEQGAIAKRPDGIVAIDYDKCGGCSSDPPCPYDLIFKDTGEYYSDGTPTRQPYETADCFEYGDREGRKNKIGKCRKCHYCLHRLEAGMLPACVTTCIGEANFFGDLNDSRSLVAEKAAESGIYFLEEALGTKPITRYLGNNRYDCAQCHD